MLTTTSIQPHLKNCQAEKSPGNSGRLYYFGSDDVNYLVKNYRFEDLHYLLCHRWTPGVNHLFDGTIPRLFDTARPWIEFKGPSIDAKLSSAWAENDLALVTFYTELKETIELALAIKRWKDKPIRPKNNISTFHQPIDIEAIKQNADIVAIAERYTSLKKSGRNYFGLCPFHTEKHGSFFVYPERQSWHCYGACGTGGDVISLVMKAENCDFKTALSILQAG